MGYLRGTDNCLARASPAPHGAREVAICPNRVPPFPFSSDAPPVVGLLMSTPTPNSKDPSAAPFKLCPPELVGLPAQRQQRAEKALSDLREQVLRAGITQLTPQPLRRSSVAPPTSEDGP